MARTINEIQDEMLATKTASTELTALEVLTDSERSSLANLTSTSKVAIWRLMIYVIAVAIFILEKLMDVFNTEIEEKVKAAKPHTADWYKNKALAFQYGDSLVDSDEYDVIDATKQIIKQVAIEEGDRIVIVKIATLNGTQLVKLPELDQVNAFTNYINKVKDAGTQIQIINEDADKLKVELEFYYDALVVASDGTLINNPTVNVVSTAINNYLKSLEFNGVFDINKMVDYLQATDGYKSLKISYTGFKAGISTAYLPINRSYKPLSGYMTLEELNVTYYAVLQ